MRSATHFASCSAENPILQRKQEHAICNIRHVFHFKRLCLFRKCVPLNIIGVRLFGFSFGWEVHKHRSRVQSQLEKNSNRTYSFSFYVISTSNADIQFKLMTEETFQQIHMRSIKNLHSQIKMYKNVPSGSQIYAKKHLFKTSLTALNTSGPSSKSTIAKNTLLEYC